MLKESSTGNVHVPKESLLEKFPFVRLAISTTSNLMSRYYAHLYLLNLTSNYRRTHISIST